MLGAINGGEDRADSTDAAAGDDIELDARFMKRAKDAGVVGASRPDAAQDQGRSPLG